MTTSMRARALVALAMGWCVSASACGGGADGCPPGTRSVAGGCVELSDAGRMPTDAQLAPDASEDAGESALDAEPSCDPSALDPLDLTDTDENCDGVDGVRGAQWYVSEGGDDANVGTFDAPFATLTRALEATPTRPILLARGEYDASELRIDVRGSIEVHGGFDASWRRTAERSRLLVSSSASSSAATAVFFGESPELVLERVELVGSDALSASAPGTAGNSAYGLVLRSDGAANGARAELRDVLVRAGAGGAGADGRGRRTSVGDGANGVEGVACIMAVSGPVNCSGSPVYSVAAPPMAPSCLVLTTQGGAGGASASAGGASGAGRAGGGSLLGDGRPGEPGRAGADGADSEAPPAEGHFTVTASSLTYEPPRGVDGARGEHGEGGGGGGGGARGTSLSACRLTTPRDYTIASVPPGSGGGSGGNGGCGGWGGGGGGGGGGSFGVVARGVELVLVGSRIETAGGGAAGAGEAGVEGGTGGRGGAGLTLHVCDTASGWRGFAGGAGGAGGDGGGGGAGAGGAGGPSLGVVVLEGARVHRDAATSLALGPAGLGGDSPGNRGPDGVRAEVFELHER